MVQRPLNGFLSTPSARRATDSFSFDRDAERFLSTPSARRATPRTWSRSSSGLHFYPRPPRGGRQAPFGFQDLVGRFLSTPSARRATVHNSCNGGILGISIHALREEGDIKEFENIPDIDIISIHALREEGDTRHLAADTEDGNFYPRPPRGGRLWADRRDRQWQYFYPRPPRGGRLCFSTAIGHDFAISIHALREEGDSKNRDKISIFL